MKNLYAIILITTSYLFAGTVFASPIYYSATDLSDTVSGDDLWRYDYRVANTTGISLESFAIVFDRSIYDFRLTTTPFGDEVNSGDYRSPAGWESLALPTDPVLEEDGQFLINMVGFDPIGAIDNLSAVTGFSVTFIWRGNGTPGSQLFHYFEAGAFDPTGQSITQRYNPGGGTAIPVVPTGWLLLAGLGILQARSRAAKKR